MRKILGAFFVIFVVAFFAQFGFAEEVEEIDPCEEQITQLDMNNCAYQMYEEADKELNEVYKELKAVVKEKNEDVADALVETQRAWIKFRDTECEFVAAYAIGGSLHSLENSSCLESETLKRTESLKKHLEFWKEIEY